MGKKINTSLELKSIQEILDKGDLRKQFKKKLEHKHVNSGDTDSYLNLFDKIHPENKRMYENAHTRILGAILEYNHNQFLKSFLERCGLHFYVPKRNKIVEVEVERQYVKTNGKWAHKKNLPRREEEDLNYCRPDCLLWNYDQFAVIIENKINHAPETEHQIDNYISAILEDHGDGKAEKGIFSGSKPQCHKNVYVVYLGGDTAEMPSKTSLSSKSGKLFSNDDNGDRSPGANLKLISYKDIIVPWLEEAVLPECPYGKVGLTGGLMVYIDYLKHFFDDERSESELVYDDEKVVQFIRNNLEQPLLPFFYEKYTAVGNRITELSNMESDGKPMTENDKEELGYLQAIKHFFLNHHFQFKDSPVLNDTWSIRTSGAFVHVWKKSWESIQSKKRLSCELYFELFPYQIDNYLARPSEKQNITCCLRYNGQDEEFKKVLDRRLSKEDGCESIDNYLFNKGSQQHLNLSPDGRFFESFVADKTVLLMCKTIDDAIVERFGK